MVLCPETVLHNNADGSRQEGTEAEAHLREVVLGRHDGIVGASRAVGALVQSVHHVPPARDVLLQQQRDQSAGHVQPCTGHITSKCRSDGQTAALHPACAARLSEGCRLRRTLGILLGNRCALPLYRVFSLVVKGDAKTHTCWSTMKGCSKLFRGHSPGHQTHPDLRPSPSICQFGSCCLSALRKPCCHSEPAVASAAAVRNGWTMQGLSCGCEVRTRKTGERDLRRRAGSVRRCRCVLRRESDR